MKQNLLSVVCVLCSLFNFNLAVAEDSLTPVSSIETGKSYALMYDTNGDKKGDLYLSYNDSRQMILTETQNKRIMWTFEAKKENGVTSTTEFMLVNYKYGTQLGVQQKDKNYVIGTNEGGTYYYTIEYNESTGGFSLLSPKINWANDGTEHENRYYMSRTGNIVTGILGVTNQQGQTPGSPDTHWIIYDVSAIKASLELGADVDYANRINRGTRLGEYTATDEDWSAFTTARENAITYVSRRDVTLDDLHSVNTILTNCIEKLTLNVPNGSNTAQLKGYYRVKSAATMMYINPTLNNNRITLTDNTSAHNPANTILYYDGSHLYFPTAGKCISNEAWDLGDINSTGAFTISKSANVAHMCSYYLKTSGTKFLYAGFNNVMNRLSGSSNADNCAWVFEPVDDLIIDDDLKVFKPLEDATVANVTYKRDKSFVKPDAIMSVTLPFAFQSEWPAYTFKEVDSEYKEVSFTQLADNIVPAGTPCFIKVSADAQSADWRPAPVKNSEGKVVVVSATIKPEGEGLMGSFSDEKVSTLVSNGANYKVSADGKNLAVVNANSYCFAFRSFLHLNKALSSNNIRIDFDEEEGNINAIEQIDEDDANNIWYNLQGQPVSATQKGMLINNNKKVIIK